MHPADDSRKSSTRSYSHSKNSGIYGILLLPALADLQMDTHSDRAACHVTSPNNHIPIFLCTDWRTEKMSNEKIKDDNWNIIEK
jgi:hypothetical protein